MYATIGGGCQNTYRKCEEHEAEILENIFGSSSPTFECCRGRKAAFYGLVTGKTTKCRDSSAAQTARFRTRSRRDSAADDKGAKGCIGRSCAGSAIDNRNHISIHVGSLSYVSLPHP